MPTWAQAGQLVNFDLRPGLSWEGRLCPKAQSLATASASGADQSLHRVDLRVGNG